jgi:hypothetical protein
MNKLTVFGTAALVTAALAVPAVATTGKHTHHHARTAQPAAAAVGTAGTIATTPFGIATADNGYYGAGWNGGKWDQGYSSRNGNVDQG